MDSINDEQIKDMFLEPAFCSANSLLSLVNDILDASLVNAGKFYLKLQEFDIREVLRKVEKMMGFQIKRKGLKLITIIDEFKISNKIKSDPQRIE